MPIPLELARRLSVDEMIVLFKNGGMSSAKPPRRGEAIFEGTDYPRDWDGFIGQEQAIEQLRTQVVSSRARDKRLEHTLLASGLHGVGKTTLAHLLAFQREVGLICTTGPLAVQDARALVSGMEDKDILFIDEAHLLVQGNRTRADWILPFLTEGKLYTDEGAQQMPDVTVVAATTDVGKLPLTLISRFMVRPKLVNYTEEEASRIVANLAVRMDVAIQPEWTAPIARAANRNPREVRMILTQIRDLQTAFPDKEVDLAKAFEWAGLSYDGLDTVAQDMLLVLVAAKNHTASVDTIQAQLGEPGPLRHHEQTLLQRGYLTITGQGRKLTEAGVERALKLVKERI